MPQIKSAIKRVKTQNATNERRASELSKLRTAIKKFKNAVESDSKEDVSKLHLEAERALDKAASKGLIHKNKAARDKRRLNKLANK